MRPDPNPTPPPGCDRGTMINQNLPNDLKIGWRIDSDLPPGTIEVWQDGKRIARMINIGVECTCHSEPLPGGGLRLIQCPRCASQPLD